MANRVLSLISIIWNWAARRDEVRFHDNPTRGIERNPERRRERFLSTAELTRLGDALRRAETVGLPWKLDKSKSGGKHIPKAKRSRVIDAHAIAAIRLLILTGARLGEVLTAKWDYLDCERCVLLLPDSKTGQKTIYLSAPALAVLETVPRIDANPFIIVGKGRRLPKAAQSAADVPPLGCPRADLNKPWSAIRKAAGLDGVRIHDLRHSYASVGAGASLGLPMSVIR